jgi:hypothetical protein
VSDFFDPVHCRVMNGINLIAKTTLNELPQIPETQNLDRK